MAYLMSMGGQALRDFQKEITATNEAFEQEAIQLQSLKSNILLLNSAFNDLKLNMKDFTENILKPTIEKMTELLRLLGEFAGTHSKTVTALISLTALLGSLALAGGVLAGTVAGIGYLWKTLKLTLGVMKTLVVTVGVLSAELILFIGLILAAAAALVYLIVQVVKHWDSVVAAIQTAGKIILAVITGLQRAFTLLLASILLGLGIMVKWVIDTAISIRSAILDLIAKTIEEVVTFFSRVLESVTGFLSMLWDTFTNALTALWESIKNTLSSWWNEIVTAFNQAVNFFKSIPSEFYKAGKAMIKALGKGIADAWRYVKGRVLAIWKYLKFWERHSVPIVDLKEVQDKGSQLINALAKGMKSAVPILSGAIDELGDTIGGPGSNLLTSHLVSGDRALLEGIGNPRLVTFAPVINVDEISGDMDVKRLAEQLAEHYRTEVL